MRKFIQLTILLLGSQLSYAQIGINTGFVTASTPEWSQFVNEIYRTNNVDVLDNGYHIGVDYWFKMLKDYRFEAMPELSYSSLENRNDDGRHNFEVDKISFHFNTHLYLLNMNSDCDCPTFSKDGPSLNKGFFIRIGPGASYLRQTIREDFTTTNTLDESSQFVFDLRLGAGFDIGVSDFLTVTPLIQVDRIFSAKWENLSLITDDSIGFFEGSVFDKFFFGLRVGLRFDELNKYGFR